MMPLVILKNRCLLMVNKKLILYFSLLLFSLVSQANLDTNLWKKNAKDYEYTVKEEKTKKQSSQNSTFSPPNFRFPKINPNVVKAIAWAILIALVVFILTRYVRNNSFNFPWNQKKNTPNIIDYVEKNLTSVDAEKVLIDHIKNKATLPEIIRLFYLNVIKKLHELEELKWKPEKTNAQYVNELKNSPWSVPFSELTTYYEKIWFGNYPTNLQSFQKYQSEFELLKIKTEE